MKSHGLSLFVKGETQTQAMTKDTFLFLPETDNKAISSLHGGEGAHLHGAHDREYSTLYCSGVCMLSKGGCTLLRSFSVSHYAQ